MRQRRRLARASQHEAVLAEVEASTVCQRAVSAATFKLASVSAASLATYARVCQAPLLASAKIACARGYTHIEIISLPGDLPSHMTEEGRRAGYDYY